MCQPTWMVNYGDLGRLGKEVNHSINPCWDIGCSYTLVFTIDGETNGFIIFPDNPHCIAHLQETRCGIV